MLSLGLHMQANTIRLHRSKLGLSRPSLANVIGVHPNTVKKWENGFSTPTGQNLVKLRTIFSDPVIETGPEERVWAPEDIQQRLKENRPGYYEGIAAAFESAVINGGNEELLFYVESFRSLIQHLQELTNIVEH
ncbi:MAG: helix-turn-helix domain-containing protein [Cellvibrionaceae bacterium]